MVTDVVRHELLKINILDPADQQQLKIYANQFEEMDIKSVPSNVMMAILWLGMGEAQHVRLKQDLIDREALQQQKISDLQFVEMATELV